MREKGQDTEPVWGNIEKTLLVIVKKKLKRSRWEMPENHKAQLSSGDPQ